MNRNDFQLLADARVADAEALLSSGRWAAAYYLAGYTVECALKACASVRFREHEVPEKKMVEDFYTHRLDILVGIAGLADAFKARISAVSVFNDHWETVRDWNENSRYNHSTTETVARAMFLAVTDPSFGVLTWLKTRY